MNIAIFTDTFMPKVDGIVTSILNTVGELQRRGHKVMITAPQIRHNQKEIVKQYDPRINLHLIPGFNAMFYPDYRVTPPLFPLTVRRLKKFKADVVHFHTPFTMGLEAVTAAKYLKLPLVSTFHTFFIEPEYLKIVNMDWVPGLVKFGWAYSNFFHDRCDMTISPSKFTAEELKRKKVKCPLMVLSNGISLQTPRKLSPEDRLAIKRQFKLKDKVMLFVGRISEEKCIDVLILAAKEVLKHRKDVSLLIVGDGPSSGKLRRMAQDEGIGDSVVFTGGIPHDKLIKSGLFEISDFFVTASTSENQPMTIIEACMFGLPVIGVNAKGVPEMIDCNGFVVEPGDYEQMAYSMLQLLNNENLLREKAEESVKMGKTYDIRRTTDQMLNLYVNLLENKNRKNGKN